MNVLNLSRIIAGTLATGSLLASAGASAAAIAFASNQLVNFAIRPSGDTTITVIGSPQRNTQNSANYGPNGLPGLGISSQDPQPLGSASDAVQASVGPVQFAGQNEFSRVTQNLLPGMVGARADSHTSAGSGLDPNGVPLVQNVAEARVGTGQGSAGASAGTNTANLSFSYTFALEETATIAFQFTNLYQYFASTDGVGESAQATIQNIFTIADSTGATLFTFAPGNINFNCASNSGVSNCDSGLIEENFFGISPLLSEGNYTISLLTGSDASVTSRQAIPEPASIAVFGLGLLSLAAVRGRRRK